MLSISSRVVWVVGPRVSVDISIAWMSVRSIPPRRGVHCPRFLVVMGKITQISSPSPAVCRTIDAYATRAEGPHPIPSTRHLAITDAPHFARKVFRTGYNIRFLCRQERGASVSGHHAQLFSAVLTAGNEICCVLQRGSSRIQQPTGPRQGHTCRFMLCFASLRMLPRDERWQARKRRHPPRLGGNRTRGERKCALRNSEVG